MSLSCSQIQNPSIAKSILSIQTKKSSLEDLQCSLVAGRKNLSNASVAELATARSAEIKSADFKSGIKNLNKAVDVLQMAESFLNHARCGIQELREIATNATGVMSDDTRVASLVPQFEDALARYVAGSDSYKYDCMPLLQGDFKHSFIVSSVCGQPSMETINLQGLDFSGSGLGLSADTTKVDTISKDLHNLPKLLQDVVASMGSDTKLTAAKTAVTAASTALKAKVDDLQNIVDSATPESNMKLGAHMDEYLNSIVALKTAFDALDTSLQADIAGIASVLPGVGHTESKDGETKVNALIDTTHAVIGKQLQSVEDTIKYVQKVQVNTYDNAVAAEHTLDTALTEATNALTKIQGQQNALNKIACLSERNVLLQNKVASEYGSVDPIETNAEISKNKLELERAVCALKESQNMEQAFSRFLSQCADYCA